MYNVVTEQSSLEDIRKAFDELNHKMEELEEKEPKDENSKEHEDWEAE